jgi:hypothetical protein
MKGLLTIILLTSTMTVFGQTTFSYKDDFKNVLAKTKDANDNLSYDKLLKRFAVNDTTLTDFEILALLIGFTDKPEFKPYQDLDTEREIYGINGDGKFKEGLDKASTFLRTHPFSVKVLFEKAYSFHKLGQEDSAAFYAYKGQKIFSAMWFSGNGKTKATPTFALGPADGQDYIHKFVGADIGIMGSDKDANGNYLDMLEAKFEDGTTVTLYFIIQHATDKLFSGEDMKKMEDALQKMEKEDKKSKKSK